MSLQRGMSKVKNRPVPAQTGRSHWSELSDRQLLDQCEVDTYRASGPGGQKRNKTSSAVRIRHLPSGLRVIAEESRSQHENRAKALRRLRQAIYLQIREELPSGVSDLLAGTRDAQGRLALGRKDPRFWPAAGLVLDAMHSADCRLATAAEALGISTANLVDFLRTDAKLWEQAGRMRTQFGHKPLRS
jgi:RF-1 domain